jgi:hypothetical protein
VTFPKQAAAALAKTDTSVLIGVLATEGRQCEGAKFHSPNPLLLSEVEVRGTVVLLCGTCLANLRVLQHLLVKNDGDLPWPVLRDFGNQIRALALGRRSEASA